MPVGWVLSHADSTWAAKSYRAYEEEIGRALVMGDIEIDLRRAMNARWWIGQIAKIRKAINTALT
jgi:hypothetical protein